MPTDPKLTHAMDQLVPLLREVAGTLTAYFDALTAAGYPPELAHQLVMKLEERLLGRIVETLGKE
jgi:hypothetical protein